MTASSQHTDVTVVGGNIVGSVTALALSQIGLRTVLIEQTQPDENVNLDKQFYELRVSAIIPVVKNFLKSLNVWQQFDQTRIQKVVDMCVWEKDLRHAVHFRRSESDSKTLAWIIENNHIRRTSWQGLELSRVNLIIGNCEHIQEQSDGYSITVTNQAECDNRKPSTTILNTKLLIGADGAQSSIRKYSGIQSRSKPYHQHCIVGNVYTERPHQKTAWQRYQNGLAFAFLPLANGACSIAWYVNDTQSDKILQQPKKQLMKSIFQASGGMLGAITDLGKLASFPIVRSDASKIYSNNLLLIGDAIRTIHPMAGQGINLGLCDVAVLAEVMRFAQTHAIAINHPLILRKYARQRSEYKLLQLGMDFINAGFHCPTLNVLRPKLLRFFNHLTPIKQTMNKIAMGYATHLPKHLKLLNKE